jgi:hypothetical protein
MSFQYWMWTILAKIKLYQLLMCKGMLEYCWCHVCHNHVSRALSCIPWNHQLRSRYVYFHGGHLLWWTRKSLQTLPRNNRQSHYRHYTGITGKLLPFKKSHMLSLNINTEVGSAELQDSRYKCEWDSKTQKVLRLYIRSCRPAIYLKEWW